MKLQAFSLPHVSEDFATDIARRFQAPTIEPETYRDKLMFDAGAAHVVAFIQSQVRKRTITGDAEALRKGN